MYIAFLHGISREDAEGVAWDKFNFWINKAQEDWITDRAKEFDIDQKRIDDLHRLRIIREIPINGTRTVQANIQLRIFSGGSGSLEVMPERYFSVSGLSFYGKTTNTGSIDEVSGAVTGAVLDDVFYALITYSELEHPIVSKITLSTTLVKTHTGTKVAQDTGYDTFMTDTGLTGIEDEPSESVTDYRFLIPNDYPNPKYFRLLNVMFKITYVDNSLFADGVSEWLRADILRADQRAALMNNAYKYPSDEKPYYAFVGEFIELVTMTSSTPYRMKLEYLRYPRQIRYVAPNSDLTAVDCELAPIQQKEIVDIAIRQFLEATKDERYQTNLVEKQIRDEVE